MPPITRVVFDVGGVVCAFRPQLRLAALSRLTGLEPSRVFDAIWASGLDEACDRGEFTLEENIAAICAALTTDLDETQLLAAWAVAFPADLAVARVASGLTVPCSAFTNNGPLTTACVATGLIELPQACASVIYGWQLGATKPSQVAFERAAVLLDEEPDHLLMVDDSEANVAGALSAEWQAMLFTGPGDLRRGLHRLGVS